MSNHTAGRTTPLDEYPAAALDTAAQGRILPATAETVARAAEILRAGGIVALPTETVYGLAANATSGEAVARIYAAKDRPRFNPLIVHVADPAAARRIGQFDALADRLADAFWPGPLTLVVPHRPDSPIAALVRAGLDTVAIRVPDHPVARAVIAAADRPLAAPSANRSGRISPTTAQHVADDLGSAVALIIDGGPCRVGLESTVVHSGLRRILRPGGITREALQRCLSGVAELAAGSEPHADAGGPGRPSAPGQLASHYAPLAPVHMNRLDCAADEAFLAFGCAPAHIATMSMPYRNLSESGDVVEAAARLFDCLRVLDAAHPRAIAVAPIPETGLGAAINDRLRRASAPR